MNFAGIFTDDVTEFGAAILGDSGMKTSTIKNIDAGSISTQNIHDQV